MPGPAYAVSSPGLNDGQWTAITAKQVPVWRARFVRDDAVLTFFGLWVLAGSVIMLQLHLLRS